jgi:hypothetical protein
MPDEIPSSNAKSQLPLDALAPTAHAPQPPESLLLGAALLPPVPPALEPPLPGVPA